jgi:hypothetical protein
MSCSFFFPKEQRLITSFDRAAAAAAAAAAVVLLCLQTVARQNPAALNRLSGFKVERAGYGSLEWLAPVDVRGVDLGAIISIERGEHLSNCVLSLCRAQHCKPHVLVTV